MLPTETSVAANEPPLKRKIAAILAADVAGYSRLVSEDEERTLRSLAAAREIFDGLVRRGGGRIFNTAGDSVMCEFDSAVEAVRVAVDVQDALTAANAGTEPAKRLQFRIGITIGDVVERGGDLLGDGVNIAARLEGIAPPGGICISRSVHEAVANKIPVTFEDIGPRPVKNLPQPIHAFVVTRPGEALGPAEALSVEPDRRRAASESSPARSRKVPGLVAIGFLLLAGVAAVPGIPALKRALDPAPTAPPPSEASSARDTVQAPPGGEIRPDRKAPTPPSKPVGAEPAKAPPREKPAAERAPLPADPAAAFAALSTEGIVPDAKSLPEHYHNARVYEARGDRQAALRAYASAAQLADETIDPVSTLR